MKDFLKKYGLLIIPAYTVLDSILAILPILQSTGSYFNIASLVSVLLGNLLMTLAIICSAKVDSKKMLRRACVLAVLSLFARNISNILQGTFFVSPIAIIAIICVIVNAILQKKNNQPEKNASTAIEVQAASTPAAVEANDEPVAAVSETPAAIADHKNENIKGTVLFANVELAKSYRNDASLTVTDEGFRYVGTVQRYNPIRYEQVDEFFDYAQIRSFNPGTNSYHILVSDCEIHMKAKSREAESAIQHIGGKFREEQKKPHIMRCNICGQIFSYSEAEFEALHKNVMSANRAVIGASMTTLFSSQLIGSIQSGNAQERANSAEDKLDALTRCPNCHSKDATEITAEEAAKIRAASAAPVQAASSADELKKFKELLDIGVITEEEFDAKKKQLLGL